MEGGREGERREGRREGGKGKEWKGGKGRERAGRREGGRGGEKERKEKVGDFSGKGQI